MVYTNICLSTESNKHLTGYSLLLEEQQKQLQLEVLQPDYKKQEVLVKKTISYSSALVLPFGKYLRVGKPLTPNLELRVLSASASTLAITTSSALAKASPSFSYVGARALQWPHP